MPTLQTRSQAASVALRVALLSALAGCSNGNVSGARGDGGVPGADAGAEAGADGGAQRTDADGGSGAAGVEVIPATASVRTSGTKSFVAKVRGLSSASVIWSVAESQGGTITVDGTYTAPQNPGKFTVVATSRIDSTKSGTASVTVVSPGTFITPAPVTGDVTVAIDSHTTSPISPYVFGVNAKYDFYSIGGDPWPAGTWPKKVIERIGGNTTSSLDWRTGYGNFGGDYGYLFADKYVGSAPLPGLSFKKFADPPLNDGTAILWTVPILPFVAGANSGRPLDWHNPNQVAATDRFQVNFVPADPNAVWPNEAKNPAGATATPKMTGPSYADDFIKWLSVNYPDAEIATDKRVMVCLDNEPDGWSWDNGAKHGWALGWPKGSASYTVRLGQDYHIQRTLDFATAIKDVLPNIDVFGGVFMGYWGLYSLGNLAAAGAHPGHGVSSDFMDWPSGKPKPGVTFPYLEMWARALNDASSTRGARLVDVLDTHFYHDPCPIDVDVCDTVSFRTAFRSACADTDDNILHSRMQAPRMYWDPSYQGNTEVEWNDGQWGLNASKTSLKAGGVPLNWIRRLRDTLAKYPMGPQKLAVTEYQMGRSGDISGAIAQADILGVFAREGVYAATYWPMTSTQDPGYSGSMTKAFAGVSAAFKSWLDYDGNGSGHGDTYASTTIDDKARPADPNRPANAPNQTLERITAYASFDDNSSGRMVIVAINKDLRTTLNVGFAVTHTASFKTVERYQTTGDNGVKASITGPSRLADIAIQQTNSFNASLPAQSITVFVLK
jgi:hypothetical protein